MTEVRTRDEALASVDQALQAWSSDMTGILVQAQSAVVAARSEIESALRMSANHVAALEAHLSAENEADRKRVQGRLSRAKEALENARRAHARVAQVQASVSQLNRAHVSTTSQQVSSARAQLSTMSRALDRYRSSAAGTGGGAQTSTGPASSPTAAIAGVGLAELDVSSAALGDNPILDDDRSEGTFGKGGLSRADYRWAVQTWNDTVSPGVAGGKTRADFVERDARSNARPLRRTADVYDIFLGSSRILVDRRPDGSLNVINGRHRLMVAQELGIKTLPGQVSG
jgi:hypothetical protein